MSTSPLATRIQRADRYPTRPVWGACVHQCGRTILERAIHAGRDPVGALLGHYLGSRLGPAYVISWDGAITALTDDEEWTWHAGLVAEDLGLYSTGAWVEHVGDVGLRLWRARWPGASSPLDLVPRRLSPNACLIGIELTPIVLAGDLQQQPYRRGAWYTAQQMASLRALLEDLAERHAWPHDWRQSRVRGHEDLSPLRRWDRGGGWDPGALRQAPRFDWGTLWTFGPPRSIAPSS